MDLRNRIAENIAAFRKSEGISQETLAARANVSRRYISAIENGRHRLTIDTIEKIALALSVDPSALVARGSQKVSD